MNAITLIQTLIFIKADDTELKTATNVLTELQNMKKNKKLPFLVIRRAIKMQESIINNLKS
jgi:hypothetical protein